MKQNFESALAGLLQHEGGFVNHPADPGGMTNLGVTKAVWEEWVGHPVTEKAMRSLQPADVAPLYRRKYWERVYADDLPAGVDYACFDAAVNSGPGRAVKWLQSCAGVTADGALGPVSMAAIKLADPTELIAAYTHTRLEYLQSLPTWNTFGRGWDRRVREVAATATGMVPGK